MNQADSGMMSGQTNGFDSRMQGQQFDGNMQGGPQSGTAFAGRMRRQSDDDDEDSIDLSEIFRAIGKNIGIIIIAALLAGIVTLGVTVAFVSPKYQSGFTAFVNNRSGQDANTQSVQSGDISASQSLTHTYASIMTSRPVIEDALDAAGLSGSGDEDEDGYTYESVQDAISTEIETDTQLVNLTVTLEDPEDAYHLARAISEVAPQYISDIVEGTSMKVVSEAILPTEQSSPNVVRNTAIGILVGALIMIVIVVVRTISDTRVKSSQQLEENFGIPVIGIIPDYESAASGRGGYGRYGYGAKRQATYQGERHASASSAGEQKQTGHGA